MATIFENIERKVIPNWRSFNKTASLGELDSFNSSFKVARKDLSILDYIDAWNFNKDSVHASDLLSAAVVNNSLDHTEVINAARFILDNTELSTFSQRTLAEKINLKNTEKDFSNDFLAINSETLFDSTNSELAKNRINFFRKQTNLAPFNPINYVEISRWYSIMDNKEKSLVAMKIALRLAPNSRFILRSAVRLFLHFDEIEYAHDLLRKNSLTAIDPWLTSAEISVAMLRERTSKFVKKGLDLLNSKNITPFSFTELASSIGTLELINGGHKKSLELFAKASLSPNDNSSAQMQWASTKDKQINIHPSSFNVQLNFEALTYENFQNDNYGEALNNAAKWFLDMPYTTRPILFAGALATTVIKEYDKAILFLKAGLKGHQNDPVLLNNLAYALALNDQPHEALIELDKIRKDNKSDISNEICLKATRGLVQYRLNNPEKGREFYREAMEMTRESNMQKLGIVALLNFTREEIKAGSKDIEELMEVIGKITIDSEDISSVAIKNDVLELYEKSKNIIPGTKTIQF